MTTNKILIVDDEPEIITIYKTALINAGFEVASAENGADGVRLAKELHPSLILMDMKMPEMNGIEAAGMLLADPEMKGTRLVFLTAFSDPNQSEMDAQMAAMQAHLKDQQGEPSFDALTIETGYIRKGGSLDNFIEVVRSYMPTKAE